MIRKTIIAAVAALLLGTPVHAALPSVITYGGYLLDGSGGAVTTSSTLTFNFYLAVAVGAPVNAAPISVGVLPSADGYFSAVLETGAYPALFADGPLYMGVAFGGEAEMSPRVQLTSAPFAITAGSVAWSGVSGFPDSACGAGQAVTAIAASGVATCSPVSGGGGGTVSSVSGTAPISVSNGSTTPVVSIAEAGAAADGYLSSGDWIAFDSKVASVSAAASGGISVGGTATAPTIRLVTCTNGEVLKAAATAGQWACGADNLGVAGVTSVGSGAGLTGGPITGAGTLSVSFAGTGSAATVARSDHTHAAAGIQIPNGFAFTVFKPGSASPVAFGFVASGGGKESGTANWTSSWDASLKRYEITIVGESYFYNAYATTVTPSGGPLFVRTDSVGGRLLVYGYAN